MAEFTFGQVEAVLAAVNDIAQHKRVAFAGRLKFLQKNKLLERAGHGRGKAGLFSFAELMRFAVGIELIKFGITPQRAATMVKRNWPHLRYPIYQATYVEWNDRGGVKITPEELSTNQVWLISFNALADLTTTGETDWDDYDAFYTVEVSDVGKMLARASYSPDPSARRRLVVHGTTLTRAVIRRVEADFGFATAEDMRSDIQTEIQQFFGTLDCFGSDLATSIERLIPEEDHAAAAKAVRWARDRRAGIGPTEPPEGVPKEAETMLSKLSTPALELFASALDGSAVVLNEQNRAAYIELMCLGEYNGTLRRIESEREHVS